MSAWAALLVANLVAVSMFARCFTGPGELVAAVSTLIVVHLAALMARGGPRGLPAAGSASPPGLARRLVWWAVALVAAAVLPLVLVLGHTFTLAVPRAATWRALSSELARAWVAYSRRVAPVPELPGLVLAAAWAAGAAALLSEALSRRRRVPSILALVPAAGLFLFASTLGTATWRAVGLAAEAAASVWYLVATARDREALEQVVVASVGAPASAGDGSATLGAGGLAVRLALLAGIAAAVIGPNLPGASSGALVSWHGKGHEGPPSSSGGSPSGGGQPSGVQVSTLVQVAQEEVANATTLLFTVHSAVVTREVVATLDTFDGNRWSSSSSSPAGGSLPYALPSFLTSLTADEQQPPPVVYPAPGEKMVVQAIRIASLVGYQVPTAGRALAVSGLGGYGQVSRNGSDGAVVSTALVDAGTVYAVQSQVPNPSPEALSAASIVPIGGSLARDVELPQPVPARLVDLAHLLVRDAPTPYARALALQAYLTSPLFHYHLPTVALSGAVVAPSPGYRELLDFLFGTRTGYCQQFATAFAVLARIDGLPVRLAVGFLPGASAGHDAWVVRGSDTHVWPQVWFGGYGWVDFEPTPGATVRGVASAVVPTTIAPVVAATLPAAHNLRKLPPSGRAPVSPGHLARIAHPGRSATPIGLLVLALLVAWAVAIPSWRRLRLARLARDERNGVIAAWRDVLWTLDLAGIRRRRTETQVELAGRVATIGILTDDGERALRRLAQLATAACYSASPPARGGSRRALEDAKVVRRSARRRIALWQRLLAEVDPRGLLR